MQVRYGEPVLFRHRNSAFRRPPDGFGRHTITIHEHNGHHGKTGAFFFPGQSTTNHYPIVLGGGGHQPAATDPRAGSPADNGGINRCPATGTRP